MKGNRLVKIKLITWLFISTVIFSLFPYKARAQNLPYAGSGMLDHVHNVSANNINRWQTILSDEEYHEIAQIVYCEANGESDTGQQMVVEVILNRKYSELFPDNVTDVLSQRNQFETWKKHFKVVPTEKEFNNLNKVLNGETYLLPYDTLYFSTKPANKNIEIIVGGHVFCNLPIK